MAHNLSSSKKEEILKLSIEGVGENAIIRLTGVAKKTVSKFLLRVGEFCLAEMHRKFLNLKLDEVEADELYLFVKRKQQGDGIGVRWCYIAMDRATRLVPVFHVGTRDTNDASLFLSKLNACLASSSLVSTDGLRSYVAAIQQTPNGYMSNKANIEIRRAKFLGKNLGRYITNQVEGNNGVLRHHCARLKRRGKTFSKSLRHLEAGLGLYFYHYNFIKKHSVIKTSPAQAAGLEPERDSFTSLLKRAKEIPFGKKKLNGVGISRARWSLKERIKRESLDSDYIKLLLSRNGIENPSDNEIENKKISLIAKRNRAKFSALAFVSDEHTTTNHNRTNNNQHSQR